MVILHRSRDFFGSCAQHILKTDSRKFISDIKKKKINIKESEYGGKKPHTLSFAGCIIKKILRGDLMNFLFHGWAFVKTELVMKGIVLD